MELSEIESHTAFNLSFGCIFRDSKDRIEILEIEHTHTDTLQQKHQKKLHSMSKERVCKHTASALTVKRAPLRECVLRDTPVNDKKGKEPCANILDLEAPKQFIWLMQLQKIIKRKNNSISLSDNITQQSIKICNCYNNYTPIQ